MLVDTDAKVTLLITDFAKKLKEQLIYTAPNISLNTATGEKAEIHGKLNTTIECGSRKFQHGIYVADVTDPCILGLDFLQKFYFTVDLEKKRDTDSRRGNSPVFIQCATFKVMFCIDKRKNQYTSENRMSYARSSRNFWIIQIYRN
ncbi:hypothetical protein AVEN_96128-1 [Araneus ventricosus]|uniref:Peptidase A2 domain-containing protein n=1 Tax=Araneus ventricosus TaxID=182803 RepID=A0A4Y2UNJ8_ARAVE|nr:hypothetical protein AVEN_96128-1 [Araneus ventricosus]